MTRRSKGWLLWMFFCWLHGSMNAQTTLYEVRPDSIENKMLVGIVPLDAIKNDTGFVWYAQALKYYKPYAPLVQALKEKSEQLSLLFFAGTWCHDSQQVMPKYFSCIEAAGFSENRYTIVSTDRQKKTVANLHQLFGIVNVPTVIVLKNGKEVGRIEEYGKTGLPDRELATLLQQGF